MKTKSRLSPRTQRRQGRKTLAELLRGPAWVSSQWQAAKGLLRGKLPKNPARWQRTIRREWERSAT